MMIGSINSTVVENIPVSATNPKEPFSRRHQPPLPSRPSTQKGPECPTRTSERQSHRQQQRLSGSQRHQAQPYPRHSQEPKKPHQRDREHLKHLRESSATEMTSNAAAGNNSWVSSKVDWPKPPDHTNSKQSAFNHQNIFQPSTSSQAASSFAHYNNKNLNQGSKNFNMSSIDSIANRKVTSRFPLEENGYELNEGSLDNSNAKNKHRFLHQHKQQHKQPQNSHSQSRNHSRVRDNLRISNLNNSITQNRNNSRVHLGGERSRSQIPGGGNCPSSARFQLKLSQADSLAQHPNNNRNERDDSLSRNKTISMRLSSKEMLFNQLQILKQKNQLLELKVEKMEIFKKSEKMAKEKCKRNISKLNEAKLELRRLSEVNKTLTRQLQESYNNLQKCSQRSKSQERTFRTITKENQLKLDIQKFLLGAEIERLKLVQKDSKKMAAALGIPQGGDFRMNLMYKDKISSSSGQEKKGGFKAPTFYGSNCKSSEVDSWLHNTSFTLNSTDKGGFQQHYGFQQYGYFGSRLGSIDHRLRGTEDSANAPPAPRIVSVAEITEFEFNKKTKESKISSKNQLKSETSGACGTGGGYYSDDNSSYDGQHYFPSKDELLDRMELLTVIVEKVTANLISVYNLDNQMADWVDQLQNYLAFDPRMMGMHHLNEFGVTLLKSTKNHLTRLLCSHPSGFRDVIGGTERDHRSVKSDNEKRFRCASLEKFCSLRRPPTYPLRQIMSSEDDGDVSCVGVSTAGNLQNTSSHQNHGYWDTVEYSEQSSSHVNLAANTELASHTVSIEKANSRFLRQDSIQQVSHPHMVTQPQNSEMGEGDSVSNHLSADLFNKKRFTFCKKNKFMNLMEKSHNTLEGSFVERERADEVREPEMVGGRSQKDVRKPGSDLGNLLNKNHRSEPDLTPTTTPHNSDIKGKIPRLTLDGRCKLDTIGVSSFQKKPLPTPIQAIDSEKGSKASSISSQPRERNINVKEISRGVSSQISEKGNSNSPSNQPSVKAPEETDFDFNLDRKRTNSMEDTLQLSFQPSSSTDQQNHLTFDKENAENEEEYIKIIAEASEISQTSKNFQRRNLSRVTEVETNKEVSHSTSRKSPVKGSEISVPEGRLSGGPQGLQRRGTSSPFTKANLPPGVNRNASRASYKGSQKSLQTVSQGATTNMPLLNANNDIDAPEVMSQLMMTVKKSSQLKPHLSDSKTNKKVLGPDCADLGIQEPTSEAFRDPKLPVAKQATPGGRPHASHTKISQKSIKISSKKETLSSSVYIRELHDSSTFPMSQMTITEENQDRLPTANLKSRPQSVYNKEQTINQQTSAKTLEQSKSVSKKASQIPGIKKQPSGAIPHNPTPRDETPSQNASKLIQNDLAAQASQDKAADLKLSCSLNLTPFDTDDVDSFALLDNNGSASKKLMFEESIELSDNNSSVLSEKKNLQNQNQSSGGSKSSNCFAKKRKQIKKLKSVHNSYLMGSSEYQKSESGNSVSLKAGSVINPHKKILVAVNAVSEHITDENFNKSQTPSLQPPGLVNPHGEVRDGLEKPLGQNCESLRQLTQSKRQEVVSQNPPSKSLLLEVSVIRSGEDGLNSRTSKPTEQKLDSCLIEETSGVGAPMVVKTQDNRETKTSNPTSAPSPVLGKSQTAPQPKIPPNGIFRESEEIECLGQEEVALADKKIDKNEKLTYLVEPANQVKKIRKSMVHNKTINLMSNGVSSQESLANSRAPSCRINNSYNYDDIIQVYGMDPNLIENSSKQGRKRGRRGASYTASQRNTSNQKKENLNLIPEKSGFKLTESGNTSRLESSLNRREVSVKKGRRITKTKATIVETNPPLVSKPPSELSTSVRNNYAGSLESERATRRVRRNGELRVDNKISKGSWRKKRKKIYRTTTKIL